MIYFPLISETNYEMFIMKKFVAAVIAIVMVMSVCPGALAAEPSFGDTPWINCRSFD